MKKPSSQIIIIVVLALMVLGFAYNKWGGIIAASIKYKFTRTSDRDLLQIGDINAKLKIVEYYSYDCEYCKIFEDEIKPKIVRNYISDSRVRWVFRPVDPDFGIAVLCANEQGKFLNYHDSIFRHASIISKEEDLKVIARNVGINEEVFWRCYSSGKYETMVIRWYNDLISDLRKHKIAEDKRGTPAFLIGDEMITGMQSYDVIAAMIEEKLKK